MTCEVINQIDGIENLTYLELGCQYNINFNLIECKKKLSVDINGQAMFTGTTDDFFKQNKDRYDITFIDANHDYEYALRDFNNAVDITDKWIIMHDMVPPSIEYTKSSRCSDSYKVLNYLRKSTDMEVYTCDFEYGLTFVKMPGKKIKPPKENADLSYDSFMMYITQFGFVKENKIIKILQENT